MFAYRAKIKLLARSTPSCDPGRSPARAQIEAGRLEEQLNYYHHEDLSTHYYCYQNKINGDMKTPAGEDAESGAV